MNTPITADYLKRLVQESRHKLATRANEITLERAIELVCEERDALLRDNSDLIADNAELVKAANAEATECEALRAERDALRAALIRIHDLDVNCSQAEDREAWDQARAALARSNQK